MKNVPLNAGTTKFAKNHYAVLMKSLDEFAPQLKKEGMDAANVTAHVMGSIVEVANERSLQEGGGKIEYDAVTKTILLGMCVTYLEVNHGFKK